ncbi:hypothetical protein BGX23_006869 [Mortierella sp. AD031]|nr:hypothetical protein BGX23_006869 [Mortierella sp. AD031]KAG0207093.1 hypothetical protein BGX33_007028 [Mortierella sp. NVP41]
MSKELHERLREKVNQLSVWPDSNTLLRAGNQKILRQVTSLEENGRRLEAKISPLNARVQEVEAEIELRKEEQKQIVEDRDRWRTRAVEIMAKHKRIDPAEFQRLKDANEKFKTKASKNATAMTALKIGQEIVRARLEALEVKFDIMSAEALLWRKKSLDDAARFSRSRSQDGITGEVTGGGQHRGFLLLTGDIYGCPKKEAAKIALKTVRDYILMICAT